MNADKAREWLTKERKRIREEIEGYEADLSQSIQDTYDESNYDQHLAETASVSLDREMELGLEDQARTVLFKIERALEKIDEGTYDTCDRCGRQIGDARHEVAPYATLCIDCRRLEEQEERAG